MTGKIQPLFYSVDNSPLIVFRIIFGFLIATESWGAIMTGWVTNIFVKTPYNFSFIGFEWLSILHGERMYYYFVIMGIAGIFVMIGLFYRVSILAFLVMWSAVYLAQKTEYNNHYYLLMLLSMLMAIVPANTYKSIDVLRKPEIKSTNCPQWCLWIFIAQISVVYFFGGVAKMSPDWIEGKPIGIWFRSKSDYFLIGSLLAKEWFQLFIAYGGVVFDTLIVPALIWKRTRKIAFIAMVLFHLFNSAVFQVGIFPYMGIAFGLFFFAPKVISKIFFRNKTLSILENRYAPHKGLVIVLICWFTIQVLLPLRHWSYSGDISWSEEGHRLSWRMMLRVKYGYVSFRIVNNQTKEEWIVKPREFISNDQESSIAVKPDMCWQFVQWLKVHYEEQGIKDIAIYANGQANLNGNGYTPLYNSEVDLTKIEWKHFEHADWLLPYIVK